jgi:hypothetical protein
MNKLKFIIKLNSDNGEHKVSIWADTRKEAIAKVLSAENAPLSAVISAKIQKPTIYDIKRLTEATAPYFFSRSSMKFFKQRMSDFKVYRADNDKFLISAPSFGGNYTQRLFNPYTNELEYI